MCVAVHNWSHVELEVKQSIALGVLPILPKRQTQLEISLATVYLFVRFEQINCACLSCNAYRFVSAVSLVGCEIALKALEIKRSPA